MKKLFYVLMFLVSVSAPLSADELHFSDGTVIKVHVISVTSSAVEYSVVGGKPFVSTQRSQLSKIVYDDGTSVSLNQSEQHSSAENPSVQEQKQTADAADQQPARQDGPVTAKAGRKDKPTAVAELECGWNGYVGLGGRIDYHLADGLSCNAGLGAGGWGYRFSGGMRYYLDYPFGLAFGLGLAWNTGFGKEMKEKGSTVDPSGVTYDETIYIKRKPVTVINATILYSFPAGDSSKVYFEVGYGYSLNKDPYSYRTRSGRPLSKETKEVMKIVQPGGIILSAGLAFF